MPQHDIITDPYIHEPKGASTANEGMVYVSNGAGSGSWKYMPFGSAIYQHSLTGQVVSTSYVKLQINGLGTKTNKAYLPREIRGTGEFWDTVNYKLLPVRQGDVYNLRVDIPITAESGSPTECTLVLDVGTGASPTSIVVTKFVKTGRAVPYNISFDIVGGVYLASTIVNGITPFLKTNAGNLTLGSPTIQIAKVCDGVL